MTENKINISVILPTYNEAENIIPLITEIRRKLKDYKFEIIVIDDDSPDKTGYIAKNKFINNKNIKVYIRKEKGLASAILYGIRQGRGKCLCVMDTDFNHDPKELPKMYSLVKRFDLIVGSRYVAGGGMENPIRNYFSLIYNRIIQFILKLPTRDNLSGFFLIKREKLKNLLTPEIFTGYGDYFIRFLFTANKKGLKIREIPVFYKNRIYGESKSQLFKMLSDYSKTVIEIKRKS
ncbi:hypothetical protein A3D78_07180 [Candidatus Gottesmanbacteria bacterium RIFCSPHIGHO2_02_FULL_39_14]|uniref:Glycosyltransferase 2-like domain-containing protein n=3 Tax=Candidatus Gottesmaniibacteriota TaxID=1752720 RepID=A0A1F5ZXR3_9BACT|nr:MAG: hypothetical protein A2153_00815 [Candidatus Gottesmanbacteria bacterium RBG_16_38_7b]OGG17248.1 MAG: hypothetical protein A3D78_07180 [Candidatus Gottesmanbacteria bacterium RIFCSPHIGHO2_02_FULL_39_14]OGG30914.1 MAG: hypothetical protein A3I51_04895 [Candidatus Gottesmanbacteria bacterium RIFCSPLOWO2_02_FULL_38_8]